MRTADTVRGAQRIRPGEQGLANNDMGSDERERKP
jgi:hypothetical protein